MPPPFNIDNTSPAPTDVISAFPTNEQQNRSLIMEWLTFLSDPATGIIEEDALPTSTVLFATGTKMLFAQTAAPTGWVKDTTHDNKALRVVTGTAGSGGTVAFTTAFASKSVAGTVGDTTLTIAQIPSHNHGGSTTSAGGYSANIPFQADSLNVSGAGTAVVRPTGSTSLTTAVDHTHGISSQGGGGSHTHSFTGTAIDLAVSYVDVIIATKE